MSGIISLQSGLPWFPVDQTNDILGTGEINNSIDSAIQTWNYIGAALGLYSRSGHHSFPRRSRRHDVCGTAATAPYAPGSQLATLALAALANFGCYLQNGGILTPPAFGTIGTGTRNIFHVLPYYNVDMSVAKDWRFKERYGVQFRAEFFNVFNRADYAIPAAGGAESTPERAIASSAAPVPPPTYRWQQSRARLGRPASHPVRPEADLVKGFLNSETISAGGTWRVRSLLLFFVLVSARALRKPRRTERCHKPAK